MSRDAIGICGVGAIGGSIGLRARRDGRYVVGTDSDEARLGEAIALGAIDARTSVEEISRSVETYVIAAHLGPTLREIERLIASSSHPMPALIVDVASVKTPVERAAASLRNFVGTHPMAGTERSGVSAARADLFEGRTWAYVPSGDDLLDARARSFIESMGASPFPVSAEEHDRAVALSSHAPQLIACCFAEAVDSSSPVVRQLSGPVAKELLRISGMRFDIWRGILEANAANIETELSRVIVELLNVQASLRARDIGLLARLFQSR